MSITSRDTVETSTPNDTRSGDTVEPATVDDHPGHIGGDHHDAPDQPDPLGMASVDQL